MSPPNSISPFGYIVDEVQGVCRPVDVTDLVCRAETPVNTAPVASNPFMATVSRSALLLDAFGSRPRINPIWNDSPLNYTVFSLFPAACSSPEEPAPPGDPLQSATPLGAEAAMNSQPLAGNLDGVQLTGSGSNTSVAWSVFDGTSPAATGSFAFLRTGTSGGSVATASNETSARHLTTTAARLDNGSTVVAYTRATGPGEASTIIAKRLSASGAPEGDVTILPSGTRSTLPDARVLALNNGFVAIYRDGGHLHATTFDNNGTQTGTRDLGTAPAQYNQYVVGRGEGDSWVLAEVVGSNQIHVRSFSGTSPGDIDRTISTSGLAATVNLSVAFNEEGTVMAAWNSSGGGISASVLGGPGDSAPFRITSSSLANTMSLAGDHRGNFFFAWEQGGQILARVYNGTSAFTTPADFSVIASGTSNSNVQAYVSDDGVFTISWIRGSTASGSPVQDLMRRDYRLNYAP